MYDSQVIYLGSDVDLVPEANDLVRHLFYLFLFKLGQLFFLYLYVLLQYYPVCMYLYRYLYYKDSFEYVCIAALALYNGRINVWSRPYIHIRFGFGHLL